MLTIRKHPALVSGMNMHIDRQIAMATQPADQLHLSARLAAKNTRKAVPVIKQKQIAANTQNLTAGMRRIFEQYRAGTYCTDDYSTRTCQRHRKYFLIKMEIDLRKPYCPSAPASPSDPVPITEQRTKYLPDTKQKVRRLPESKPKSVPRKLIRRACVSDTVFAKIGSRIRQPKIGRAAGLAAMTRFSPSW